jgi:hypothetical protein
MAVAARGAETPLTTVQRELRARKYYLGPIDGRASPELKSALQEFQTARGLDGHGEVDEETLRALGLRKEAEPSSAESRALRLGRDWLARFGQACESGDWKTEAVFYAGKVRYYYDGEITREALGEQRTLYYQRWPARKQTALLCYASWNPRRLDELWVSARVRNEVVSREGERKVFTEELLFVLHQNGDDWQLAEVREWPLATPLKLP